ncbi:MAG: ATP synthase F0 subunit B [Patescibacteria group bacterium]
MEGIITTFHIDWKIILAQAVNFGIVVAVFYFFALKPLTKIMSDRAEKIARGIKDAKDSEELLKNAATEYEKNTIKLQQMAIDAKKELNKDLEDLRLKHLEQIKQDNQEWVEKRKQQLEIDKRTLVESAKSEVASLAMLIVEKITAEKNK